jgi:hypothetical protein
MECSILGAKKVPYVTMSIIVYVIVITIVLLSFIQIYSCKQSLWFSIIIRNYNINI